MRQIKCRRVDFLTFPRKYLENSLASFCLQLLMFICNVYAHVVLAKEIWHVEALPRIEVLCKSSRFFALVIIPLYKEFYNYNFKIKVHA